MISESEKLACALVWDEAGHLTEEAVAMLADGELTLLPDEVPAHAGTCDACAERVGQAALFSLALSEAIAPEAVLAPHARSEPLAPRSLVMTQALPSPSVGQVVRYVGARAMPVPSPAAPLALALLVAAVASVPLVYEMETWIAHFPALIARGLPRVAHWVAVALGGSESAHGYDRVAALASGMLVLVGAVVAAVATRATHLHAKRMSS